MTKAFVDWNNIVICGNICFVFSSDVSELLQVPSSECVACVAVDDGTCNGSEMTKPKPNMDIPANSNNIEYIFKQVSTYTGILFLILKIHNDFYNYESIK